MPALNDKKTKVMIMGDINIDLASQTNYVSDYNLLLRSNFFFSLITKPTRVTYVRLQCPTEAQKTPRADPIE